MVCGGKRGLSSQSESGEVVVWLRRGERGSDRVPRVSEFTGLPHAPVPRCWGIKAGFLEEVASQFPHSPCVPSDSLKMGSWTSA